MCVPKTHVFLLMIQIWRGLSFNPNFLSIGPTVRIAGQDILKTKKSSEKGKKFSDPPLSTRH